MKRPIPTLSRLLFGLALLCMSAGVALLLTAQPALAQDDVASNEIDTSDENYCLICHENSSQTFMLADGSQHDVAVDLDALANSVHGTNNPEGALACSDCHQDVQFPHEGGLPESERIYTVSNSLNCTECHSEQTENLADGVHYTALIDGNLDSASCVDCHGSHGIQEPTPQSGTLACGTCHTTTFAQYEDSIHGEALLVNNDTNAPACIECHGVHGIQHPTTALFRNRSPELCATCHADDELMEQYDISTNVFESYLSDFHGTTVSLFQQTAPNVATNKAVCYDCHGVHNITPADDVKSTVARENLLATCQECHPNAEADFPDSWVGHFEPTLDSHPLLFAVDWFYRLLIPAVLGAFVILVLTDLYRRIRPSSHHGEASDE